MPTIWAIQWLSGACECLMGQHLLRRETALDERTWYAPSHASPSGRTSRGDLREDLDELALGTSAELLGEASVFVEIAVVLRVWHGRISAGSPLVKASPAARLLGYMHVDAQREFDIHLSPKLLARHLD